MSAAPLLRSAPWLSTGRWRGGLTTRIGFPSATWGENDDASRVELRSRLATGIGADASRLAWAKQLHSADVFTVNSPGLQGEGDALVSDRDDVVLLVAVADCGPVLLLDPSAGVHAACHAGWRGVVGGVIENTVRAMEKLGASADRVRAWVGPCIGVEHFEVGPEVAAQFPDSVVRTGVGRPHVDLAAAIVARLRACGINGVESSGDCTYARSELYWSYRRDGGICGRHLGFIGKRNA